MWFGLHADLNTPTPDSINLHVTQVINEPASDKWAN